MRTTPCSNIATIAKIIHQAAYMSEYCRHCSDRHLNQAVEHGVDYDTAYDLMRNDTFCDSLEEFEIVVAARLDT